MLYIFLWHSLLPAKTPAAFATFSALLVLALALCLSNNPHLI
jgi:hypothetical protein